MRIVMLAAAAASAVCITAVPAAARAELFASSSNWNCLVNAGGSAVLRACRPEHNTSFPYNAGTNEFYGEFRQGGQCLAAEGSRVYFANCNGSAAQRWKLAGSTTQLNNELGICIRGSGGSVSTAACPQRGTWANAAFARVPQLAAVPRGTVLTRRGNDLVGPNGQVYVGAVAQIVAAGGGNIVAAGGGNIVAAGGGNIVAGGGGNIVAAGGLN